MTKLHPAPVFANVFAVTLAQIAFLFGPSAYATNSINVQTFNPSTSDHFAFLEDGFKSEWPKTAKYYFGANYNYMSDPLVVLDSTQTTKAYNIIDDVQTLDLFFGFKASNNLGLFFALPINYINYSDSSPAPFKKGSVTALGDAKVEAKIRITDDDSPTSVAIIPEFHLPTGSTGDFVSDASTYIGLRVAIERQFENFSLVGNVGFGAASNASYQDSTFVNGIDDRKRLILGIGAFKPFNDQWGMNVEFNDISMIPFDSSTNPNDLYAGLRYAANDSLIFTAGASIGKIGGPSGSDYRIVAGIRYTVLDDKKVAPKPIYIAPMPSPTPFPTPKPIVLDSAPHANMTAERIEITTPIHFENDAYKLAYDSRQILDDVVLLMQRNKSAYKQILVDGHTSSVGTDAYNMKLSLARAESVKNYMVSKGIPANKLVARGFGKRKPKVPHTAYDADEINRRVEFNIVK